MKPGMCIVYSYTYKLHAQCHLEIFNYKILRQYGYLRLCMADTFNTDNIDINI